MKCLTETCPRVARHRSLCASCYYRLRRRLRRDGGSWEEAERAGECGPCHRGQDGRLHGAARAHLERSRRRLAAEIGAEGLMTAAAAQSILTCSPAHALLALRSPWFVRSGDYWQLTEMGRSQALKGVWS